MRISWILVAMFDRNGPPFSLAKVAGLKKNVDRDCDGVGKRTLNGHLLRGSQVANHVGFRPCRDSGNKAQWLTTPKKATEKGEALSLTPYI